MVNGKLVGGETDWAKVAALGLRAANTAWAVNQALNPVKAGFQGTVPVLQATRQQVATDPNARPGAGGQRYFTDTQFTPAAGLPAAQAAATQQATTLAAANQAARPAPVAAAPVNYDAFFGRTPAQVAAQPQPVAAAHGGLMHAAKGRYLQGATDGMADKLPAQIGNDQPAKLSHGEFVIPADVVSHLGNGNSDAGAQQLYKMMSHIRKARTGNEDQGKRINPDKFMPGGLARAYAAGGPISGYADGGTIAAPAGSTGMEQTLSSYAAPYVTNMLAQGQALAQQPYQAYQGPLTAGASGLQQQGFGATGALQTPAGIGQAAETAGKVASGLGALSYTPTGGTFDAGKAQQYMNPYLQASLNPQLEEARRQSQITQQQNAAKMTQAGAFGGSRQAILDAETQRSLGTNLANITGQGYNKAFEQAQQQYNTEQGRNVQENQFGAGYGLQALQGQVGAAQTQGGLSALQNTTNLANIGAQLSAGEQQRGIEQQGMTADQAAFAAERDNPYKMVTYQQSLLQGLPLTASNYTIPSSPYSVAQQGLDQLTNPVATTAAPVATKPPVS